MMLRKASLPWTLKIVELALLCAVVVCLIFPTRFGAVEKPRFCKLINRTTDWPWAATLYSCEAAGSVFDQLYPYDWLYDQLLRILYGLLFLAVLNKVVEMARLLIVSTVYEFTVVCAINAIVAAFGLGFLFFVLQAHFTEHNQTEHEFPLPWIYASYAFVTLFFISFFRVFMEYYLADKPYKQVPFMEVKEVSEERETPALNYNAIPVYTAPEIMESSVDAANTSNVTDLTQGTPAKSPTPTTLSLVPFEMVGFGGIAIKSISEIYEDSLCNMKSSSEC
uniref:TRP domain-containing protein n=1 Tax=Steinernema glaseri TaxID=37863 RepID=A0A1I7ZY42_9BILA